MTDRSSILTDRELKLFMGDDRRNKKKKNIALLGLFAAAAIVLGYVESFIPVFAAVPGIKIGLANLAVISVLYIFGLKEAAAVSLVRIIIIGFLFGNMVSIFYSLAGAFLSMLVMFLLKKWNRFSIIGVSIAGGVAHNLGQILLAMAIVETYSVIYYFPILMISGILAGIVIGIVGGIITKRISVIYVKYID